jgi:hypothetical protein
LSRPIRSGNNMFMRPLPSIIIKPLNKSGTSGNNDDRNEESPTKCCLVAEVIKKNPTRSILLSRCGG